MIDLSKLITAADKFATAQQTKVAELSNACKAAILAGFDSDALGATHMYPAKDTDQANLSSSVVASLLPDISDDWTTPFWCADTGGIWTFRPHTAAQIQQVGRDAKAQVLACMTKNATLAGQAQAATTPEQLAAITWQATQ
jgi:hypothetical protein